MRVSKRLLIIILGVNLLVGIGGWVVWNQLLKDPASRVKVLQKRPFDKRVWNDDDLVGQDELLALRQSMADSVSKRYPAGTSVVTILGDLGAPIAVTPPEKVEMPAEKSPPGAITLIYAVGYDGEEGDLSRWPMSLLFLVAKDGTLIRCTED